MGSLYRIKLSSDITEVQITLMDFYALEYMVRHGFPSIWGDDIREELKLMLEERKQEVISYLRQSLAYAIAHQFYIVGFGYAKKFIENTEEIYLTGDTELNFIGKPTNINPDFKDVNLYSIQAIKKVHENPEYFSLLDSFHKKLFDLMYILDNFIPYESMDEWEALQAEDYDVLYPQLVSIVKERFELISTALMDNVNWWEPNLQAFKIITTKDNFSINEVDYLVDLVHSSKTPIFPHLKEVLDYKRDADSVDDFLGYVSAEVKPYVRAYQKLIDTYKISIKDIAMKNIFSYDEDELEKGINVELEHTSDEDLAEQIAEDHLKEHPKYYTKMEGCLPHKARKQAQEGSSLESSINDAKEFLTLLEHALNSFADYEDIMQVLQDSDERRDLSRSLQNAFNNVESYMDDLEITISNIETIMMEYF